MPERSYLPEFNYIYNISNSFYVKVYIENILITDPYECLPSKYAD